MKKILISLIIGIIASQSFLLANLIEEQKKALEQSLSLLFKYKNVQQIKEMYAAELNILEIQYERNKQVEDFQKRQQPEVVRTPIFTSPSTLISSKEWEEKTLDYANKISVTKIPRRSNTELVFHFPQMNPTIYSALDSYKIQFPTLKVVSVLLSSGKLLTVDQTISSKVREQSITIETDGDTILKINLKIDYQIPNESNAKTILSASNPSVNGITLLPSFANVMLLKLSEDKVNSIIYIDAEDRSGYTLATKTEEKIINTNDLSTQSSRIELLKGLIKGIDDKKIKFPREASDYLIKNSDKYLEFLSNPTRELSKTFSGDISRIIIYTAENPVNKTLEFSLY